jgi:hypothetical protein
MAVERHCATRRSTCFGYTSSGNFDLNPENGSCFSIDIGNTNIKAEWIHEQVVAGRRRIALVAPTAGDVRDVMVEGESGVLAVSRDGARPTYEPSKRRLTWPNGAIATTKLPPKQEKFVQEYLIDLNAAQAAIRRNTEGGGQVLELTAATQSSE